MLYPRIICLAILFRLTCGIRELQPVLNIVYSGLEPWVNRHYPGSCSLLLNLLIHSRG